MKLTLLSMLLSKYFWRKAHVIADANICLLSRSNVELIARFQGLKTLIMDHNNVTNLRTFPSLPKLETLSLAYNALRDMDATLIHIAKNYPVLKHLNLIKNPMNPMFGGQSNKYETFRAKFKIWIPTLVTLDGIDFNKD